jgi:hypothetical protein
MPQILVRDVDKSTVDALKLRASRRRTPLQAEAKRIQQKLRRRGAAFTDSGRSQAQDRRR